MPQLYDIPASFFELNRKFWPAIPETGKYFLVDLLTEDHEYWNVTLISARMFAELFKLEPVVLLPSRKDAQLIRLVESYGLKRQVFLDEYKVSFFEQGWLFLRAGWHWLWARSKGARLNFRYEGFTIGHYIYDTYLNSRGFGTIRLWDLRYGRLTWWALRQMRQYLAIFSGCKYELYFGSEQAYMNGGIPSVAALLKGAEICYRQFTPHKVSYRFYRTAEDLDIYTGHPDHRKFEQVLHDPAQRKAAVAWTDNYLKNLFAGVVDIADWNIAQAYANTRSLQQGEYQTFFGNDYKKRIFIFCHILTDAAHGYREGLFDDYETWLRETLKIAAQRKDVLWVLKPHPSERYFLMRTTIESIYKEFSRYENIKLFPGSVSVLSAISKIDAIMTVRGTAAVEYAAMGVPVIVAGRNMFDEDGFEVYPKTFEEYRRILLAEPFNRLSPEAVERAKVSLYAYNYCNLTELPLLSDLVADPHSRITPKAIYDHLAKSLAGKKNPELLSPAYREYVARKYDEAGGRKLLP
jgi:hypothetical protein